jgi:hypothetical protein
MYEPSDAAHLTGKRFARPKSPQVTDLRVYTIRTWRSAFPDGETMCEDECVATVETVRPS